MKIIDAVNLTTEQKENIIDLWNREYPGKLKLKDLSDFENYLKDLTNQHHFLLTNDSNKISGWLFSFVRENEKWFAMIIDSSIQGRGYGTVLINKLKDKETKLCGWVIDHENDKKQDGEYYKSPLQFYIKNNFVVSSGTRLESEKMSAVKIEWIK